MGDLGREGAPTARVDLMLDALRCVDLLVDVVRDDTGDALHFVFGAAVGDRDELDVWVEGVYAGRLHRRDTDVDFSYDPSYRAARTPALSVSMPKSRSAHGGNIAGRWIDNLLPDNDEVRQRWAAHFGESGRCFQSAAAHGCRLRRSRTGLADQHCTGHRCRK